MEINKSARDELSPEELLSFPESDAQRTARKKERFSEKISDLGEFARIAKRRRRSVNILNLTNGLLLILGSGAAALTLGIAIGLLHFGAEPTPAQARLNAIETVSLFSLFLSFILWCKFVWLDGWLFYPPSEPSEGKRGVTREWYHSITYMVTEEPGDIARGLADALNINLKVKTRAVSILNWGMLIAITSASLLACVWIKVATSTDFAELMTVDVEQSTSEIQSFLASIAQLGRTGSAALSEPPQFTWWGAAICYSIVPFSALYFSQEIVRNAIDMRWSLLTTPDILYKMQKNVLYVLNDGRDYTWEQAVIDARTDILQYGIARIPEDFIDMKGRLFFYSGQVRKEFVTGRTANDQ